MRTMESMGVLYVKSVHSSSHCRYVHTYLQMVVENFDRHTDELNEVFFIHCSSQQLLRRTVFGHVSVSACPSAENQPNRWPQKTNDLNGGRHVERTTNAKISIRRSSKSFVKSIHCLRLTPLDERVAVPLHTGNIHV